MKKAVEIILCPGTRIPGWIRNQTLNVEISRVDFIKRTARSLKIRGGEAIFFPGGRVVVKMPGSDEYCAAFGPKRVLEIRNLRGKLIKRNYYLCAECGFLTGYVENYRPSDVAGLMDKDLICTTCGYRWKLKRV